MLIHSWGTFCLTGLIGLIGAWAIMVTIFLTFRTMCHHTKLGRYFDFGIWD